MNQLDVIKEDMARAMADARKTADTNAIAFVKMAESEIIDEVTAAEHSDMFEEWEIGISYNAKDIRKYNGSLFKCILGHVSQDDWRPDVTSNLWKKIGDPTEEFPAWSQPIGAFDSYSKGDKVSYEVDGITKHFESLVDNNVWLPIVETCWKEI